MEIIIKMKENEKHEIETLCKEIDSNIDTRYMNKNIHISMGAIDINYYKTGVIDIDINDDLSTKIMKKYKIIIGMVKNLILFMIDMIDDIRNHIEPASISINDDDSKDTNPNNTKDLIAEIHFIKEMDRIVCNTITMNGCERKLLWDDPYDRDYIGANCICGVKIIVDENVRSMDNFTRYPYNEVIKSLVTVTKIKGFS